MEPILTIYGRFQVARCVSHGVKEKFSVSYFLGLRPFMQQSRHSAGHDDSSLHSAFRLYSSSTVSKNECLHQN